MKIKVKVTGYSDNKITESWYQSLEVIEHLILWQKGIPGNISPAA